MDVCFLMRLVLNRIKQYLLSLRPHLINADGVSENKYCLYAYGHGSQTGAGARNIENTFKPQPIAKV